MISIIINIIFYLSLDKNVFREYKMFPVKPIGHRTNKAYLHCRIALN